MTQKNGEKKRTGRTGSTVGSQMSKHYKAQKKVNKKNKELHCTKREYIISKKPATTNGEN